MNEGTCDVVGKFEVTVISKLSISRQLVSQYSLVESAVASIALTAKKGGHIRDM